MRLEGISARTGMKVGRLSSLPFRMQPLGFGTGFPEGQGVNLFSKDSGSSYTSSDELVDARSPRSPFSRAGALNITCGFSNKDIEAFSCCDSTLT